MAAQAVRDGIGTAESAVCRGYACTSCSQRSCSGHCPHFRSGSRYSQRRRCLHRGSDAVDFEIMLSDFTGADKVYIACGYTDLLRGIDGLAAMVRQQFDLDPFTNTLFLFCGRRRDRIKALYWEGERLRAALQAAGIRQSIREYQKAIEEQVIFWIMVALAVLLIFVLLIYRVTKPVMISVNDIVDAMKNLEKDNFREKLEVKEKDSTEIQEISEGFNEMSERIHNLIGQVKESAMEQKNAEISALEAQIDPHFLYNILDTINWKAIENEQYEISEMLVALADILRYAINDAGEFTTIDAEKGWLEKYILLQQEKLGEEIELEFKIQDSYGKCKIHKMLLQPFVENAIKYSFRGYEGAHRLTIEVSKAEEQMHIIIANNGRHIEEDQLKDLNMGKEIKNHFGISNVRKRLKLYYGEDAVIYFENVSPSGVKVHLFVPLQEEQKDEDSSY